MHGHDDDDGGKDASNDAAGANDDETTTATRRTVMLEEIEDDGVVPKGPGTRYFDSRVEGNRVATPRALPLQAASTADSPTAERRRVLETLILDNPVVALREASALSDPRGKGKGTLGSRGHARQQPRGRPKRGRQITTPGTPPGPSSP
jgi:hypothetical protein